MLKITIIGAGHGGLALAAHFTSLNNQVTICADIGHPGFSIKLSQNKNIITVNDHYQEPGKIITTQAKIYNITHDYKLALSDSELIFIVTPSFAHEDLFTKLQSYIKPHHKIITLAGNFSTIIFNNILQKSNNHTKCLLADISSLPYACRVDETGHSVDIFGLKKQMGIAAIPANRTKEILNQIKSIFPSQLIAYKNSLEIGLNITSGISHPISALFNAGRIGKDKDLFYFYKEGISEHTNILLQQLDADRRQIGKLYNLDLPEYTDLMAEFYGNKYSSIYDFFTQTPIHNARKLCPSSLSERYISQDVPYVIVPWYTLGKVMGFESTVMRNIIELASIINKTDYLASGLNKEKLMPVHSSVKSFINNMENGCLHCFPSEAA